MKKQYQKLDDIDHFAKIIKKEKPNLKKYHKLNLICDSKYSFLKNFDNLSFKSIYSFLINFFNDLIRNKFSKLKPQKEETKKKTANIYDTTLELYNDFLEIYFYKYKALLDVKNKKFG